MALLYQASYLFLLFLFCWNLLVSSRHLCDPKQHLALLDFKKSFSLSKYASWKCELSYPKTETWKESRDCCSWDGVDCDKGHVVGLDLSCSSLSGTLHRNSTLFTLSHLQFLNLSHNDLYHSPFSPQFGTFKNLRVLDLSYSGFEGEVPSEISHLSRLVSLHLSGNHISFSNVVMNQLVHNLTHLTDFALDEVNLSNIRPTSFMNFSLSLASLRLSSCSLTHNFPDHILGLPNLRVLDLSHNTQLKGHLPVSNWSKSLEILNLSFTNFAGGIPNSIGEAKSLRYLELSVCNFSGEIPEFQIHSNPFKVQVPNCLFNLTKEASSNSFSSPLMANVCSDNTLSNLIYLGLGANSFVGPIPSWIYALPRLKYLSLTENHFSAFMRDFKSNSLEILDLSDNNLQGEISKSIYRQVNLTGLALDSNNLSGVLNFDMLLRIQNLEFLDVSSNSQLSIFSTINVSSAKNLCYIYMSSVKLEKFPYFLRYQKNLSYLGLSHNQIRGEIPKWVSELGALSELYLSYNLLSSGMEVLLTLPNLNNVYLDFNLFNKLPIPMSLPPSMAWFSVSSNQLRGNIHPSICQATNLVWLDLSNNSLSGAIPSCLFNMTNLHSLMLKRNNFSCVIPVPPSIKYYIASENQFDGEIPPSICHAPNLTVLSLSNNRLSGTIPPCLANMPFLEVLDLKNNNFTGTLPKSCSTESQLMSLDLNDNQIEGELPRSLLNCKYLEVLDLGNNKITDYFPYWLEAASNLQVLILRSNRFYGHINNSMNKNSFPNLRIIDLSRNNFSGPLPSNWFLNLKAMKETEVGNIYPQRDTKVGYYRDSFVLTLKGSDQKFERILMIFKAIDLSSNDFSGEIPKSIGMLVFLKGLNLSHNKFTGEIPTSFGNLTNLEALDLSSNKLMDNIPSQLTGLTCLSFLNLSQNQLSGPIPQGKQFGTFENSSYIGNVGLCGFPLPNCDAEKVHKSQLLHEEGDNLEKGFWWKVVFIGYGCGMPFGMFGGFLVFRMAPVWIVAMVEAKTRKKNYRTMKRNN